MDRITLNEKALQPTTSESRKNSTQTDRLTEIKKLILKAHVLAGRLSPEGQELDFLAVAYEYALDDIPTEHLEECFRRAVKAKADNFPVSGTDMRNQWVLVQDGLRQKAKEHALEVDRQLIAGRGSLGAMHLDEWKVRHNLPADWRLGDPFPLDSDLYGKPVPVLRVEAAKCERCKDAHWLRIPAIRTPAGVIPPLLVKCPDCNSGEG